MLVAVAVIGVLAAFVLLKLARFLEEETATSTAEPAVRLRPSEAASEVER